MRAGPAARAFFSFLRSFSPSASLACGTKRARYEPRQQPAAARRFAQQTQERAAVEEAHTRAQTACGTARCKACGFQRAGAGALQGCATVGHGLPAGCSSPGAGARTRRHKPCGAGRAASQSIGCIAREVIHAGERWRPANGRLRAAAMSQTLCVHFHCIGR